MFPRCSYCRKSHPAHTMWFLLSVHLTDSSFMRFSLAKHTFPESPTINICLQKYLWCCSDGCISKKLVSRNISWKWTKSLVYHLSIKKCKWDMIQGIYTCQSCKSSLLLQNKASVTVVILIWDLPEQSQSSLTSVLSLNSTTALAPGSPAWPKVSLVSGQLWQHRYSDVQIYSNFFFPVQKVDMSVSSKTIKI